ncbi:hypothetical protein PM082_001868 [Marasmius tenuissimus]|nr:hypothetical protein PM082_001868 [Marasmius tenuissimus]
MGSLLTAFSSTFQLHPTAGLRSAFAIEQLLHLSPGEAVALVSGLHSCLDIPGDISENISPLHGSFTEFLIDRRHAGAFNVGARLSYQGNMQMLVTSHLRMLLRLVAEFKRATYPGAPNVSHESEPSIGSLNAWRYFYEHHPVIDITGEIVGILNDFDPHSYFSMLLHWDYLHDWSLRYSIFHVFRPSTRRGDVQKIQDWRYRTIAIGSQISMLYSVFRLLKRTSSSKHLDGFLKNCTSFFRGFYVAFPRDRDDKSIRFSLLTCQLSISRLHRRFSDWPSDRLGFWADLGGGLGHDSVTLRVIPLDQKDRDAAQSPSGWGIKIIRPIEGRLLRTLLERVNDHAILVDRISDIFVTREFETWTYHLSRLCWTKTWSIFLFNRVIQAVIRERARREISFELAAASE